MRIHHRSRADTVIPSRGQSPTHERGGSNKPTDDATPPSTRRDQLKEAYEQGDKHGHQLVSTLHPRNLRENKTVPHNFASAVGMMQASGAKRAANLLPGRPIQQCATRGLGSMWLRWLTFDSARGEGCGVRKCPFCSRGGRAEGEANMLPGRPI